MGGWGWSRTVKGIRLVLLKPPARSCLGGCMQWATRLLEEGAEQLMMLCMSLLLLLLLLQEKLPSKAKRPVGRPRKGAKQ